MASTQKAKVETKSVGVTKGKSQLFELPVSQVISAARKALGLSVVDLAESTKISSLYLKLIEADDIHNHLERVYVLGFIRSYANALNLDGNDLVKNYKMERKWASYPANFNEPPKPKKKIKSANKGFMKYVNIRTVSFGLVVFTAIAMLIVSVLMQHQDQNIIDNEVSIHQETIAIDGE